MSDMPPAQFGIRRIERPGPRDMSIGRVGWKRANVEYQPKVDSKPGGTVTDSRRSPA